MEPGVEVFLKGLRDLDYKPMVLEGKPDHVVIDYMLESGKLAGTKLRHASSCPRISPLLLQAASTSQR